jgi:uncharacterized UBP type Zn finger protein
MEDYNPLYLPSPNGSHNIGVICWLNSLMQGLLSSPTFVKTVLSHKKKLQQTDVGIALYNVIWYAMYDTSKFHNSIAQLQKVLAYTAKQTYKTNRVEFGFGQECANEGFVFLLDLVQKKDFYLSNIFTHRYRCDIVCTSCRTRTESGLDHGMFISMGNLRKPISSTEEFVNELKLHITQWDKKCKCGNKLIRRYRLTMIPEVMIILFDKYQWNGGPRLRHYTPNEFSLQGINGKNLTFVKVAQIDQSGMMSSGHYTALGLRKDGVYMFNDATVHKSNFIESPNTYLVIFNFKKYN